MGELRRFLSKSGIAFLLAVLIAVACPSLAAFRGSSQHFLSKGGYYRHHLSLEEALLAARLRWNQAERHAKISAHLRRKVLLETPPSSSRVVISTDFGADPTGQNDSAVALQAAIDQAFNLTTSSSLINGIADLGSVELRLEGGNFVISKPLRFPGKGGGNLVMHGGSIRATSTFPTERYLIELVAPAFSSWRYPYEDVTFRDMMLDCNFRGGGLRLSNALRTSIENVYVTHFQTDGILVQQGHETYISNSFIGQYITAGSDPSEGKFSGVGINLVSNDNVVTDCVVFSAAVGIVVKGQANLLHGNHLYNKATGFGGVGIQVELPGLTQTRIVACYLDYTGIVATAPSELEVSDSFFLADGNIVLKSSKPSQSLSAVTITNNMFSGSRKGVPIVSIDESKGAFESLNNVLVDFNTAVGMQLKATSARATLRGNLSTWSIDLSSRLLFASNIQNVQYSLYCPGQLFPRHALRSVVNNTVVIETDVMVPGTMSVLVDQSSTSVLLGATDGQSPFDSRR